MLKSYGRDSPCDICFMAAFQPSNLHDELHGLCQQMTDLIHVELIASIKRGCIYVCVCVYMCRYIILSTACSWTLEGYDIGHWKEFWLVLQRLNVKCNTVY